MPFKCLRLGETRESARARLSEGEQCKLFSSSKQDQSHPKKMQPTDSDISPSFTEYFTSRLMSLKGQMGCSDDAEQSKEGKEISGHMFCSRHNT